MVFWFWRILMIFWWLMNCCFSLNFIKRITVVSGIIKSQFDMISACSDFRRQFSDFLKFATEFALFIFNLKPYDDNSYLLTSLRNNINHQKSPTKSIRMHTQVKGKKLIIKNNWKLDFSLISVFSLLFLFYVAERRTRCWNSFLNY